MATLANWPKVWLLLAALALVGGILILLFIRNKPSDLNQLPDGGQAGAGAHTRRAYQTKVQWESRDVFKAPAFWLMVVALAIVQGLAVPTMLATMGMDMLAVNIPVSAIGFIVGG